MSWYSHYFCPHLLGANTEVVILIVSVPVVQVHLRIVRIEVDTSRVHQGNFLTTDYSWLARRRTGKKLYCFSPIYGAKSFVVREWENVNLLEASRETLFLVKESPLEFLYDFLQRHGSPAPILRIGNFNFFPKGKTELLFTDVITVSF